MVSGWWDKHPVCKSCSVLIFVFVWFDSLRPINNLSVIKGRVFLGWTTSKLGLMFLLKDTTQWRRWGSNLRPLGLGSSTLPLSYCTPILCSNKTRHGEWLGSTEQLTGYINGASHLYDPKCPPPLSLWCLFLLDRAAFIYGVSISCQTECADVSTAWPPIEYEIQVSQCVLEFSGACTICLHFLEVPTLHI